MLVLNPSTCNWDPVGNHKLTILTSLASGKMENDAPPTTPPVTWEGTTETPNRGNNFDRAKSRVLNFSLELHFHKTNKFAYLYKAQILPAQYEWVKPRATGNNRDATCSIWLKNGPNETRNTAITVTPNLTSFIMAALTCTLLLKLSGQMADIM